MEQGRIFMVRKRAIIRITAFMLSAILSVGVLSGCGQETASPGGSSTPSPGSGSPGATQKADPVKLTWYQVNRSNSVVKSMSEVLAFQELAKLANVEITFEHPAAGTDANEQINLLIASQSLPDIIFWNWKSMPGGISKYVEEGIILPINDLETPYYDAVLEQYPECAKFVPLQDGRIPAFYQLDPDPRRTTYSGFCIRQDWLEKLNLSAPTTMDEWHTVLTAFKNEDPNNNGEKDEIPFLDEKGNILKGFTAAYGVLAGLCFDPETGKVVYGPAQPSYREFLSTMSQWYAEGLIDSEFASNDRKMFTAKIQGEIGGAFYASINVGVGNNIAAVRPTNPDFSVVGIPAPKSSGGVAYMPQNDNLMKLGEAGVITSKCKDPQAAAALLDLGYSEEGRTLLNWGVEGVTYTVENGQKKFVDSIMNPGEGLSPSNAILQFAYPANGNAKVMDFEAAAQIQYVYEESVESIDNWLDADPSLMLHPNMYYTPEESSQISNILNEVKTYHDEMALKFILGTEPLSKFDEYVQIIRKMGIDEAIKLTQDAVDRLNSK